MKQRILIIKKLPFSTTVLAMELPVNESSSYYNFTLNTTHLPQMAATIIAYVSTSSSEAKTDLDREAVSAYFCINLEGIVMNDFSMSISEGTILSPNGRFELQLDRMSTEGFFIFDNSLGRVVRSYTNDLFVQLSLENKKLVGTRFRNIYDFA